MFIDWKTTIYHKDVCSATPTIDLQIQCNSNKNSNGLLVYLDKLILNFIWKNSQNNNKTKKGDLVCQILRILRKF